MVVRGFFAEVIEAIGVPALEERLMGVVETELELDEETFPIELSLTSRDAMGFRMLLGRRAIRGRCVVDPGRSYLPRDRLDILATYEVPVSRSLEDAEIKRSSVWRFRA